MLHFGHIDINDIQNQHGALNLAVIFNSDEPGLFAYNLPTARRQCPSVHFYIWSQIQWQIIYAKQSTYFH